VQAKLLLKTTYGGRLPPETGMATHAPAKSEWRLAQMACGHGNALPQTGFAGRLHS